MNSMTGFGSGQGQLDAVRIHCEIRSVNQKGVDVKVRLPRELSDFDLQIAEAVKKRCARGRFDVSVRMEASAEPAGALRFDQTRLASVIADYRACREQWPELDARITFGDILQIPGILNEGLELATSDHLSRCLLDTVDGALDGLLDSRAQEGASLQRVLKEQLAACTKLLEGIAELVRSDPDKEKKRIKEKLAGIDVNVALSEDRLAQEVLYAVEKSDVTEEVDRLRIHLEALDSLCNSEGPIGRKMDFLCQEIFREMNTLGNKIANADASLMVIDFKSELQRTREQVQNIE